METIIGSIITGGLAFMGVLVSSANSNKKLVNNIKSEVERNISNVEKNIAITDTKIEDLTREVREHNNFAKRMPVVEEQIKGLQENIQ